MGSSVRVFELRTWIVELFTKVPGISGWISDLGLRLWVYVKDMLLR